MHTNTSAFPSKIIDTHPPLVVNTPQWLPPSVFAALTIAKLHFNPHYRELHEQYDYVTGVLALYMDRGKITKGKSLSWTFVKVHVSLFSCPGMHWTRLAPALHTDSCRSHMSALGFNNADSYVLSSLEFNNVDTHEMSSFGQSNSCTSFPLGPSDLASQSACSDVNGASEVKHLLSLVEVPSVWPSCVDPSILWYFEDCLTNRMAGDIVMEANRHQLKMHPTLCHENGSLLSSVEFNNVQLFTDLHITRLIELATDNPHLHCPDSKLLTMSNIKKWFKAKYSQAILELEAEQLYPCLCSAHWKADNMIGQAFLHHSDAECRHHTQEGPPNHGELPAAPILVLRVATINVAKCAFELSPGPKSPLALHTQKCSKDKSKNSGQKNKDPLVVLSSHKYSLHWSSITI